MPSVGKCHGPISFRNRTPDKNRAPVIGKICVQVFTFGLRDPATGRQSIGSPTLVGHFLVASRLANRD